MKLFKVADFNSKELLKKIKEQESIPVGWMHTTFGGHH